MPGAGGRRKEEKEKGVFKKGKKVANKVEGEIAKLKAKGGLQHFCSWTREGRSSKTAHYFLPPLVNQSSKGKRRGGGEKEKERNWTADRVRGEGDRSNCC